MEQKEKGEMQGKNYYYQLVKTIAIALLVIVLGLIAVNQALYYRYQSVFLQTPCELCVTMNEHLKPCFSDYSTVYTDMQGNQINNITEWKEENIKESSEINWSFYLPE